MFMTQILQRENFFALWDKSYEATRYFPARQGHPKRQQHVQTGNITKYSVLSGCKWKQMGTAGVECVWVVICLVGKKSNANVPSEMEVESNPTPSYILNVTISAFLEQKDIWYNPFDIPKHLLTNS